MRNGPTGAATSEHHRTQRATHSSAAQRAPAGQSFPARSASHSACSWQPVLGGLLDLSQPAALLVAVLHSFPDSDQPGTLAAELRDALAPGSYVRAVARGT